MRYLFREMRHELKVPGTLGSGGTRRNEVNQLTKEIRNNRWAEIIIAASKSGLTKKEFCKQNGISRKTFYNYQKKLGLELYEAATQVQETPIVEVPVIRNAVASSSAAAVIHAGALTIEITDGISETTLMSIGRMIRNAL